METPAGYVLGKCLWSNAHEAVYRAVREENGRVVQIKILAGCDREAAVRSAEREVELLGRIAGDRVPRVLDLVTDCSQPMLVLDCPRGQTLRAWARTDSAAIDTILAVGIRLSQLLGHVHAARIVHGDVSPDGVVVDPDSLQVGCIDFGFAHTLGGDAEDASASAKAKRRSHAHPYISPEQTGRMDRGVDPRSDLYSLGATLYFLITREPPFDEVDPLSLFHAQLARVPTPVVERRPETPATVSRIIAKLLQKTPEDRYQTAPALARDLTECQRQLATSGFVADDFPLGTADKPYRPLFSKQLYGRETEVEALRAAYRNASAGAGVILRVTGTPGMGKSALIAELRPRVAKSRGYFAKGKFDQYRSDLPYSAFIQAFDSIAHQLLTESEASLVHWRKQLTDALGSIAGAVTELIPDLGIILGDVPPVPRLGPRETGARLSLAFSRLIDVLATREHPLVLFLDDLQWSDAGSRDLLESIAQQSETAALLVIAAYRSDEIADDHHPAHELITNLAGVGQQARSIDLGPLSSGACAQMLADALGRAPSDTRVLADLVQRKTANSPLLIQQFVYHLYDRALIRFTPGLGWSWNDNEIAAAAISDDATSFILARMTRLDAAATQVLQLASCTGNTFSVRMLVEIADLEPGYVERALFRLSDQGLIAPVPGGFSFVHDRIRESAQSMLSSEDQARLHYHAATHLLSNTPPESRAERAYELADHLYRARSHLHEQERTCGLELGLLAAKTALSSGVPSTARRYLDQALALLRNDDWTDRPDLAFELYMLSATCAEQTYAHESALEHLDVLRARPLSRMQDAQVTALTLRVHTERDGPEQVLPLVLESLRRFGIHWSANPSRLRVRFELLRADWALRGPLDESHLRPAPPGDHSSWFAPLLVMVAGGAALNVHSVRLVSLVSSYAVRAYVRHGYVHPPARALASYAAYRHAVLGHLSGVERYARATEAWNERDPRPPFRHRAEEFANTCLWAWVRPRRSVLAPLRRAYREACEHGDLEFSHYAFGHRVIYAAMSGEPLGALATDFDTYSAITRRRGRPDTNPFGRATRMLIRPMPTEDFQRELTEIDEGARHGREARIRPWVFWLLTLCILGKYEHAWELAEEASEWADDIASTWSQLVDYYFFWGITAAELATGSRSRRHRRVLARSLRRVRTWARHGPDFEHMLMGLKAERARLRGHFSHAQTLYANAIRSAAGRGYSHHAGFLNERLARLLVQQGRRLQAASAIRQAILFYRRWGASAKIAELREEWPECQ